MRIRGKNTKRFIQLVAEKNFVTVLRHGVSGAIGRSLADSGIILAGGFLRDLRVSVLRDPSYKDIDIFIGMNKERFDILAELAVTMPNLSLSIHEKVVTHEGNTISGFVDVSVWDSGIAIGFPSKSPVLCLLKPTIGDYGERPDFISFKGVTSDCEDLNIIFVSTKDGKRVQSVIDSFPCSLSQVWTSIKSKDEDIMTTPAFDESIRTGVIKYKGSVSGKYFERMKERFHQSPRAHSNENLIFNCWQHEIHYDDGKVQVFPSEGGRVMRKSVHE